MGIPLGYMLMEKSGEDRDMSPGEETCRARFFGYARSLDINPIMAHTDKCISELNDSIVCILDNYLMTDSMGV